GSCWAIWRNSEYAEPRTSAGAGRHGGRRQVCRGDRGVLHARRDHAGERRISARRARGVDGGRTQSARGAQERAHRAGLLVPAGRRPGGDPLALQIRARRRQALPHGRVGAAALARRPDFRGALFLRPGAKAPVVLTDIPEGEVMQKRIGIIMNGVTGRMGTNQHLLRSILAIRKEGGVALKDGTRLMPDPILIGRNPEKLAKLAKQHGVERYSVDLKKALQSK